MECKSIGFLVEDTNEKLVLAQSAALDKNAKPWSDVIVIPKVSIKSMNGIAKSIVLPSTGEKDNEILQKI